MSGTATKREGFMWKACLLALVAWVIGYALLASPATLAEQAMKEHTVNIRFLGATATQRAEDRAMVWYQRIALDSGWMQRSMTAFASSGDFASPIGQSLEGVTRPAKNWAGQRVLLAWALVLQFLVRLSVAMLWWGFLLVCLFPCIVDGVVVRKIKTANFGLSSPHTYVVGRHVVFLTPLVLLLLLLAPMTLPASTVPILCALFGAALWAAIVNFPKRA